MTKKLTIILGDQLFEHHPCLDFDCDILMVESITECKRLRYHKFRLAYLFTTMREYADYLKKKKKVVYYYTLEQQHDFKDILHTFSKTYSTICICEVNDHYFTRQLSSWLPNTTVEILDKEDSQMFLTKKDEFKSWLVLNGKKKLLMANFYSWQRKRLKILVDKDLKPLHGKWSFDDQNRKKLPKFISLPNNSWNYKSVHFNEVVRVIEELLPDNPGNILKLWLAVTHEDVKKQLTYFIDNKLQNFGPYEDALSKEDSVLFHSVLSPALNNGLITPKEVVNAVITAYENNPNIPFSSVEGFIRQIIGWREWVKGLYDHVYTQPINSYNFMSFTKPLPEYFYTYDINHSDLKNNTPLQLVLSQVGKFAWSHHIERLMILSNWMLLNEFDPHECFEWFSSQFVDAFEWVMVPNVLGMGLFADGGIYSTKPYISGGNYIKKMSNYPDSKVWEPLWTEKYWSFLKKHRALFNNNPRLNMIIQAKFG
jgi:deoxyribodipyrimidine photolyase-related protein